MNFKRFFTFQGRLLYIEGTLYDGPNLTVNACHELSFTPPASMTYSGSSFQVLAPSLLTLHLTSFPLEAKSKLLADVVTDFGRERVLNADQNASRS